ncbi:hypothetical protein D9M71_521160 [compost metagenome]
MGQVAEQVGRGAARGGRQQHQAHCQRGSQAETFGDQKADERQEQNLAGQADQYRFGEFHHAGEIGQGQGQAQSQHDEAQGNRQKSTEQWRCSHVGGSQKRDERQCRRGY